MMVIIGSLKKPNDEFRRRLHFITGHYTGSGGEQENSPEKHPEFPREADDRPVYSCRFGIESF
jgi:hypothetical protein